LAKIDNAWAMSAFEIVRATADDLLLSDAQRHEMKTARFADRNNGPVSSGAIVPASITHQFVAVRKEEDKYAMLQYLLTAVCPDQPALLFLGDNLRVRDMVQKMRYSGIPRAEALHEAMGFHLYDSANASSTSSSTPPSSSTISSSSGMLPGEASSEGGGGGGAEAGSVEALLQQRQGSRLPCMIARPRLCWC